LHRAAVILDRRSKGGADRAGGGVRAGDRLPPSSLTAAGPGGTLPGHELREAARRGDDGAGAAGRRPRIAGPRLLRGEGDELAPPPPRGSRGGEGEADRSLPPA